ncbi:MAG: cytochrome bd ubiquinol oxidase subunit [Pseudomonadota bacterium]|jgi:cytochrome d ubiquinol oxidase subunit II|nr:cytochrome d ubiquinol oxidase subunit II [Burkholderiales bacterium]MBP9769147.1 cytochrome d ubiquinol oxidase subunit II [Burkholderiales bacterium]MDQ5947612.1 cytochrome bd ubiquinol oxidase subunit [Pseudomonadota bacterium]
MEYAILRVIWWVLVAVLMIGLMIMDGHDMGVGTLSPFVGKTDSERRAAINSVAPHWDGNQVWFITGGGAVFAAWPLVYAASFSMLYIAILAVLWTLFLRAPAFDYRSKIENPTWRATWDWVLFVGSAVPPLLFGVAVGNVMLGIPFHFDDSMRLTSDASNPLFGFLGLLSPFALLCGLVSFCMTAAHGGVYLSIRTEGAMQARAKKAAAIFSILAIVLFAVGGLMVGHINGYVATNLDPNAASDPLMKTVEVVKGAWLNNYKLYPITMLVPALGFIGLLFSLIFNIKGKSGLAFIFSGIGIAGIILTSGVSMFPFIMPSSSDPISSLTAFDATSSEHTLLLMLVAALIFTPIILTYTSWVYKIMRGKLTTARIEENSHTMY